MADLQLTSAAELRARLSAIAPVATDTSIRSRTFAESTERKAELRRLRAAVALRDMFTGSELITAQIGDERAVAEFVAADCERVDARTGAGWRLRLPVRHIAINYFVTLAELLATLDALPPSPDDIAARMAVAALTGHADLGLLTVPELSAMTRALSWLEPTRHGLTRTLQPRTAEVHAALARATVLAPLLAVVDDRFVGRKAELSMLSEFLFSPDLKPRPLLLHGPGGVGKSTLLAKCVLENVGAIDMAKSAIHFAYLTFDRADLSPDWPLTLLSEACRQLIPQAPFLGDMLAAIASEAAAVARFEVASVKEISKARRNTSAREERRDRNDEYNVISAFAQVVSNLEHYPYLLLIDTFEQAQLRGPVTINKFNRFIRILQEAVPTMRVVIAGRAEDSRLDAVQVALPGFDREGAIDFLVTALHPRNLDVDLLKKIVDALNGNPLTLRLAAELIRRTGAAELRTISGQQQLLADLSPELVQGMLYRRILDHIGSVELRALANPGLAIRIVTAELIRDVLAEPCGLGPLSRKEARRLFDELSLESLVYHQAPGVLAHRADVRREMLPLLRTDNPARFAAIHLAAVSYYAKRAEVRDRAEELYHRLMLGAPSTELDRRWMPGVEPWLQTALDEVPRESRAYLAHRLEIRLATAEITAADDDAWVRKAAQDARVLIDAGRPNDALNLLASRSGFELDETLLLMRIEALAVLGDSEQAIELADRGLAHWPLTVHPAHHAALCLLAERISEDRSDFMQAFRYAEQGLAAARVVGETDLTVSLSLALLRINRRWRIVPSRMLDELRPEVIRFAANMSSYDRARNPALLRELAAEIGEDLPVLLSEAAKSSGVELVFDTDSDGSSSVLASDKLREIVGPAGQPPNHIPNDSPAAQSDRISWTSKSAGRAVGDYLESEPDDAAAAAAVAEYFQIESDAASFDYRDRDDSD